GNVFENCGGIKLDHVWNYAMAGNVLKDIDGSGFSCNDTRYGSITGNTVNNCSGNGLTMTSTENVFNTITGNFFGFIDSHGIWLSGDN
ncbi:right-handed parallel beta-helix repeat-containing protein, partial [Micrococcus sp. SIMBA_144]